jgi:hypothetical protein
MPLDVSYDFSSPSKVLLPSELVQVRDSAKDSESETANATENTTSLNIAGRLAENKV